MAYYTCINYVLSCDIQPTGTLDASSRLFYLPHRHKDYSVRNYVINLHIFVQCSYLGLMHRVNNRNYSIKPQNNQTFQSTMFNSPFSISCLMQLVFIHHHLSTPLGENGCMYCTILQFGTVHRQLYVVAIPSTRAAKCFAGSGVVAVYYFQHIVWSSIHR